MPYSRHGIPVRVGRSADRTRVAGTHSDARTRAKRGAARAARAPARAPACPRPCSISPGSAAGASSCSSRGGSRRAPWPSASPGSSGSASARPSATACAWTRGSARRHASRWSRRAFSPGQLQRDPALESVGCVIFDEFHERSLQADLGLALVLDAQRHVRPDLRVLVMSATLDAERRRAPARRRRRDPAPKG